MGEDKLVPSKITLGTVDNISATLGVVGGCTLIKTKTGETFTCTGETNNFVELDGTQIVISHESIAWYKEVTAVSYSADGRTIIIVFNRKVDIILKDHDHPRLSLEDLTEWDSIVKIYFIT